MRRLDPAQWIEANLAGVRKRGISYEAECPSCGKPGHLYVHGERGYFTCFAKGCGFRGRDLARLIAQVEGISEAEARERMFRDAVRFSAPRPASTKSAREKLDELRAKVGTPTDSVTVDVPTPASMIPIWDSRRWRMPRYLLDRGISRRTARRFGLGFCEDWLCPEAPSACRFPEKSKTCIELRRCRYAGRVILPIVCPAGRSFTARSFFASDDLRYLNPPAPKGRLLFGWQSVVPEGELVVVEGPFDALRLAVFGLPAVAVMGLTLSPQQRSLLFQVKASSITVMLDSGIEAEAQAMASSLLAVTEKVYVARLPEGLDPGESDHEQVWTALKIAEEFRADRAGTARSFLRRFEKRKKTLEISENPS